MASVKAQLFAALQAPESDCTIVRSAKEAQTIRKRSNGADAARFSSQSQLLAVAKSPEIMPFKAALIVVVRARLLQIQQLEHARHIAGLPRLVSQLHPAGI